MKQTIFILAVLAALLLTFYLRDLLGKAFFVIAVLFGGSLATAGLHYFDLRRRSRNLGVDGDSCSSILRDE